MYKKLIGEREYCFKLQEVMSDVSYLYYVIITYDSIRVIYHSSKQTKEVLAVPYKNKEYYHLFGKDDKVSIEKSRLFEKCIFYISSIVTPYIMLSKNSEELIDKIKLG